MEEDTRDTRKTSDSQVSDSRKTRKNKPVTYTPPALLEVPEEVKERFLNKGYILRWIRYSVKGEEDFQNVSQRHMEGYEFVKIEEVPEMRHRIRLADKGTFTNLVTNGDVALAKIPAELAQARQEYYENQARLREQSINRALYKNNSKEVPIYNDSKTDTRKGKNAEFAP